MKKSGQGLKNCLTAQPLKNGNILVCEMNEGKAIEYNRDGDIVWKIAYSTVR